MSDDVDQNPDENGKKSKFGEIVFREASSQDGGKKLQIF